LYAIFWNDLPLGKLALELTTTTLLGSRNYLLMGFQER